MAPASESVGISILSWNIRGLKAKLGDQRKNRLLEIFGKFDVVLLQETHIGEMNADVDADWNYVDADWNYITEVLEEYALKKLKDQRYTKIHKDNKDNERKTMYMTYFCSRSKGVAILINKPHKLLSAFCEGGDYAWVHVEIDNQKYTFVSVYYSDCEPDLICDLMLKIFYSFLTDGSVDFKSRLVIGGDFNTTLDPALDANKEIKGHAARRKRLNKFMSIVKLSDVWRENNDKIKEYTHIQPRRRLQFTQTRSRIDYIFMLKTDVVYVESCDIHKIELSDHFPVSLTLKVNNTNNNERTSDIQQRREE